MLRFTVPAADEGCRVDRFLRSRGVSASLIRAVKYLPMGICVNGQQVHTNFVLAAGSEVAFNDEAHTQTQTVPQDIPLHIVYEDEQLLVINKPAGMAVHPTRNYTDDTLANAFCGLMRSRGQAAPFRSAGRLDKNTSGLMVCALTAYAIPPLQQTIQKTYYALAEGEMQGEGVIDAPIGYAPDSIIRRAVTPEGKRAVTQYRVLASGGGHTLLQITLKTGRTHQIRVHFSHLGHPLAGDDLYGGSTQYITRHALHCGEVRFVQPYTGLPQHITVPLPPDMQALARQIGCKLPSGLCAKE